MPSRKLNKLRRRRRTRRKAAPLTKESYTLGHLAAAHLLNNGVPPETVFGHCIDTESSPEIEGALIAAYLDPNSYIVFADMPVSIRDRHKRSKIGAETSFRKLLVETNIPVQGGEALTKTESEQGRSDRESLGLPRSKNSALKPSGIAHFPHEFYRRYYGS